MPHVDEVRLRGSLRDISGRRNPAFGVDRPRIERPATNRQPDHSSTRYVKPGRLLY